MENDLEGDAVLDQGVRKDISEMTLIWELNGEKGPVMWSFSRRYITGRRNIISVFKACKKASVPGAEWKVVREWFKINSEM